MRKDRKVRVVEKRNRNHPLASLLRTSYLV